MSENYSQVPELPTVLVDDSELADWMETPIVLPRAPQSGLEPTVITESLATRIWSPEPQAQSPEPVIRVEQVVLGPPVPSAPRTIEWPRDHTVRIAPPTAPLPSLAPAPAGLSVSRIERQELERTVRSGQLKAVGILAFAALAVGFTVALAFGAFRAAPEEEAFVRPPRLPKTEVVERAGAVRAEPVESRARPAKRSGKSAPAKSAPKKSAIGPEAKVAQTPPIVAENKPRAAPAAVASNDKYSDEPADPTDDSVARLFDER